MSTQSSAPLPGGHLVGDRLYWTKASRTYPDRDKLTYGQAGEVVGPATHDHVGKGAKIHFPGNTDLIESNLSSLSREPPPEELPGGHRVGDRLYFAGASTTYSDGDKLTYGQAGEVVGLATLTWGKGVAMRFPENHDLIACYLSGLSRTRRAPGGGGCLRGCLRGLPPGSAAMKSRVLGAALEHGKDLSPIAGLFPAGLAVEPLDACLAQVRDELPSNIDNLLHKARRNAADLREAYPGLTDDDRAILHPQEDSLYFRMNAALREVQVEEREPTDPLIAN